LERKIEEYRERGNSREKEKEPQYVKEKGKEGRKGPAPPPPSPPTHPPHPSPPAMGERKERERERERERNPKDVFFG
jgi:hypothetical protein